MVSSSRRVPVGVWSSMRHPAIARKPIQSAASGRPFIRIVATPSVRRSPHGLFAAPCPLEPACDIGPVDYVPPRVDVVGPAVLGLEVVRVLPDIAAKDRGLPAH